MYISNYHDFYRLYLIWRVIVFSKTMPRISSQVTESTDPAEYETDDSKYDHAYSRGRTLSKTTQGQCDSIFLTPKKWSLPVSISKPKLMHMLCISLCTTHSFFVQFVLCPASRLFTLIESQTWWINSWVNHFA